MSSQPARTRKQNVQKISLHLTYCLFLRTVSTPHRNLAPRSASLPAQRSLVELWCFVCESRNSTEIRSSHSRRLATGVSVRVRAVVMPVPVRATAKIAAAGCWLLTCLSADIHLLYLFAVFCCICNEWLLLLLFSFVVPFGLLSAVCIDAVLLCVVIVANCERIVWVVVACGWDLLAHETCSFCNYAHVCVFISTHIYTDCIDKHIILYERV